MGAERPVPFWSGATPMQVSRCGTLSNQTVAKYLPLPRLAAGPERPQLVAAHHSENTAGFPGRSDCPVKGMSS